MPVRGRTLAQHNSVLALRSPAPKQDAETLLDENGPAILASEPRRVRRKTSWELLGVLLRGSLRYGSPVAGPFV